MNRVIDWGKTCFSSGTFCWSVTCENKTIHYWWSKQCVKDVNSSSISGLLRINWLTMPLLKPNVCHPLNLVFFSRDPWHFRTCWLSRWLRGNWGQGRWWRRLCARWCCSAAARWSSGGRVSALRCWRFDHYTESAEGEGVKRQCIVKMKQC